MVSGAEQTTVGACIPFALGGESIGLELQSSPSAGLYPQDRGEDLINLWWEEQVVKQVVLPTLWLIWVL